MITTIILVSITLVFLIISLIKSRNKTKQCFKLAKNMFFNIASQIIGVLLLIGLILVLIPRETINQLMGNSNKWLSTIYGAIIGTITIIPGVIAFPLAKELYDQGAILMALAAFITTLTMVGVATIPIEIKHFGKKFTFIRNIISFGFAIVIALFMGVIL